MILNFLRALFPSKNQREIEKHFKTVMQINDHYEEYQNLSEEQLKAKTDEFRERHANGETLDELLPEAFAAIKDACSRMKGRSWKVVGREMTWDMVPFDVQLVGGIILHEGKIAEMATGEGKTLVATLPLYLNALSGKGAHLVTVNDYLAQRDSEWMGEVLKYLGLTVGVILNDMNPEQRTEAYNCDVTYGTNNEFGFDYLRDNMAGSKENVVQIREHNYAIVDEVDSVLIDEARTPLIISGPVSVSTQKYDEMKPLVDRLTSMQNRLVSSLIREAVSTINEGKSKAGAMKLLVAERGAPKNKRLLKLYQEPSIKKMVQEVENDYLRDKAQNKASDEHYFSDLYYIVDEKSHTIDLTEAGREALNPSDPEMFLLPDMGEQVSIIEDD